MSEEEKITQKGESDECVLSMTRRGFFKSSAIALGGLAAAMAVAPGTVSIANAQAVDRTGCEPLPWDKPVAPIPSSEIKKTVDTDVLIIGCGLAGLITAVSAREEGVKKVIIIDKNRTFAARGIHNAAFGSKIVKEHGINVDYRQVVREWIRWAQGRVNEDLLWLYAKKSGACMDWFIDQVSTKDITVGLWDEYFKGPDYTEYPVTHIFTSAKTKVRGNPVIVEAMEAIAKEKGVEINYQTPAVQLVRIGDGRVTGVIAGRPGNYTRYNASKGVVIATGDYASNKQMCGIYAPIANMADSQIYFPNKCNTGDGHIMAMQAGGSMQKTAPHAAVIHLEAGAMSYGFLHVNAEGKRFKNEDVNTQSKSCSKLFEPGGVAWTVYDSDGLNQVEMQIDSGIAGGLFYGQMDKLIGESWSLEEETQLRDTHIKQGKVVTANTLDELARLMGVPAAEFKKTVERYNALAAMRNDEDYGKRVALLQPVNKPPYYAGKLMATVLTMSGGLKTGTSLNVYDKDDKPVEGLYVVGSAAGDFFAVDYPTIVPGIGHGRCIAFGRMLGVVLAGKPLDTIPSIMI